MSRNSHWVSTVGLAVVALVGSMLVATAPAQAAPGDQLAGGWGANWSGQLGDGTKTDSPSPVTVSTSGVLDGKTIKQVSSGAAHACAVTMAGVVACWGENGYGQLGNGTKVHSSVPVLVDTSGVLAGKTVTSISAGSYFSCAVTTDGVVACWGANTDGQLGDGTQVDSSVPVLVDTSGVLAGKTVASISAGNLQACALTSGGLASCWGANTYGQLGDNSTVGSNVPVLVDTSGVLAGKTVASISAGYLHSCALTADGVATCWGYNGWRQLGNDSVVDSSVPVLVDTSGVLAGKTVASISAGGRQTCAVTSGGTAACWGDNEYGQLGNGSDQPSGVPVAVNTGALLAGKTLASISAGLRHTCAVTSDSVGACWGSNAYGQLGNGSTTSSSVPVAVSAVSTPALGNRPVIAIAAGGYQTVAVYGYSSRPGAPSGLGIGGMPTTFSWTAPTYVGSGVTDYGVYYRYSSGTVSQRTWKLFARGISGTSFDLSANASGGCVGATDCRRLHGALNNGTSYDFMVLAFSAAGNGKTPTTPVTTVWAG